MGKEFFQSDETIHKWCQLISASFPVKEVFYVGSCAPAVVQTFESMGIQVTASAPNGETNDQERSALPSEMLVFSGDIAEPFLKLTPQAFQSRFGKPKQIVVVLSTVTGDASLPDVSRWLWDLGYTRELSLDLWVDSQFLICTYNHARLEPEKLLEMYEAEWWRLAQASEKRRALALEYRLEMEKQGKEILDHKVELENLAKGVQVGPAEYRVMRKVVHGLARIYRWLHLPAFVKKALRKVI